MRNQVLIIGALVGASVTACGDDTVNPFVFDAGTARDATSAEGGKDASRADASADSKEASPGDASTDLTEDAATTANDGSDADADDIGADAGSG
jgi:hypothetical protein